MKNLYSKPIERMKLIVSNPQPELSPYIEKYVSFENRNISKDVYPKLFSNGKVELFICFNKSHVSIISGTKETKQNNFIFGISQLTNPLKIKLMLGSDCFKGISITFFFRGVYQLLNQDLKAITNRVVSLESIFGKRGKQLVHNITKAHCHKERENILNQFFMMLLIKKKLSIIIYQESKIRKLQIF